MVTPVNCNTRTGAITLSVGSGGTPPYKYRLGTTGLFISSNVFNNLKAGTYKGYIMDGNGCIGSTASIVLVPASGCNTSIPITARQHIEAGKLLKVVLSPNPTRSSFTLIAHGTSQQSIEIKVLDVNGKSFYTAKGFNGQTFHFGENFASGVYLAEVRQGNETVSVKAVKIR